LGEVRAKMYDAEGTLREAERTKQRIATYLYGNLDFGPEDVFLGLADQCFTSSQTRWTYEACIFKQAVQREGYSNSVTVGRWAGFSSDYKTMLFTGGDECWNVGPRSFTVKMSCGLENQLSDGEEPATCAYSAKFTSPALCNDEELIALRNQLASLEAFEREVAEKIAKDEL
jgi:protein kinase C substrate 80K-H